MGESESKSKSENGTYVLVLVQIFKSLKVFEQTKQEGDEKKRIGEYEILSLFSMESTFSFPFLPLSFLFYNMQLGF